MTVNAMMERIYDIDTAINKLENKTLTDTDREHILLYLNDYKSCLKSMEVAGGFDKVR